MSGVSRRLSLFLAFAMVIWPVGQAMPPVPGTDSYEQGSMKSVNIASVFGVLTEDDLEVEYHDFTIVNLPVREAAVATSGRLISFLWTERLHRPPIS